MPPFFIDAPSVRPIRVNASTRAIATQYLLIPVLCLTMFSSSALLFIAEPMFAKMVLPLLGGTPAVWNTCMVSFQALLLAAYAYGHWSIRFLGIRRQIILQVGVLIAVTFALPIAIPTGWRPSANHSPILWLLALVPVGIGLPFFAVATTAPVLQKWFSASTHPSAKDPYFLYAASNVGSLAALLAYPTLLEPFLRLARQSHFWSAGYLGLIALTAGCALLIGPVKEIAKLLPAEKIPPARRLRWILLAMVPSSLLLGSTTFITTDIAAVPLLWMVPLAIYLLSFILVFASKPVVSHRLMARLQPVVVLSVAFFILGRVGQPVWFVLALHLLALFVSSMVCHGELAADRPSVGRLTDFYLTMSLGGVLGGMFNALLAPLIFSSAVEYPMALIAACALCPIVHAQKASGALSRRSLDVAVPAIILALALMLPRTLSKFLGHDVIGLQMLALGIPILIAVTAIPRRARFIAALAALFFVASLGPPGGTLLAIQRSFFGIHRAVRNPAGPFNDLYHGTTVHGRQRVDPASERPIDPTTALTYYYRTGPIGQFLLQRTATVEPHHIGLVGMGVGSLAAYATPGDQLTYYEIDPVVRWMAQDSGYFTFLKSAEARGATVRIIMGDARLTLRDTPASAYDTLVLDAFSGDAIPVHLLTRQAMQIYLNKLTARGILAIHISNMYLDLLPVCSALAADAHLSGLYQNDLVITPQEAADGKFASQWVLLSRFPEALSSQRNDPRWKPLSMTSALAPWTDDFSNIFTVFRWR